MSDEGNGVTLGWRHRKRVEIYNKWRKRGVTDPDQLARIADKVMRNKGLYR